MITLWALVVVSTASFREPPLEFASTKLDGLFASYATCQLVGKIIERDQPAYPYVRSGREPYKVFCTQVQTSGVVK